LIDERLQRIGRNLGVVVEEHEHLAAGDLGTRVTAPGEVPILAEQAHGCHV
jgi:hypothetical protein